MKKICLLLLLTTFPLNLFCQQSNEMVLDSSYSYHWDSKTNNWIWYSRYVYAFDVNGNLTEYAYYHWDSETNDLVGDSRYVYTYDANRSLTGEIYNTWDSETND